MRDDDLAGSWVTPAEAARSLGLSSSYVRRLKDQHKLPEKNGRICIEHVDALLAGHSKKDK